MKDIILLTSQYPYGKGENFIENELKYISKNINVNIVSTAFFDHIANLNVKNALINNSGNIKAFALFTKPLSSIGKLLGGLIAISHLCFWQEIWFIWKRNKLNCKVLREIIAFIGRGERIYRKLQNLFKEKLISYPRDILLYSYWMHDTAYAAVKLKKKYGCMAITRAHGGDLYDERLHTCHQPLREYLIKNLDAIYCISGYGKSYLESKYGLKDNIYISHLGTVDFGNGNIERIDDYFVIVSCAYMIPIKRIHLLALAIELLGKELPNSKIKWIHFGGGPEYHHIEKIIMDFPENVEGIIMGDTLHKEIMVYYKSYIVNLFVNVSSTEGIPVSVLEAMSFGIPILATDVGGTSEAIKDGYNGWLIPGDINAENLAIHIKRVIEMPKDEYYKYGYNARKFWFENFSAEKNYTKFHTMMEYSF